MSKKMVNEIRQNNDNGTGFLHSMLLNGANKSDELEPFVDSNIAMYQSLLSNMYMSATQWNCKSGEIKQEELDLIEFFLLRRGWCVILKPKYYVNKKEIILNEYKVFEASSVLINNRLRKPISINILNVNNNIDTPDLKINYNNSEFHLISLFPNLSQFNVPYFNMVRDYALKLNDIDLTINMQIAKLKIPVIAEMEDDKEKNQFMLIAESVKNNGIFAYVKKQKSNLKGGNSHPFTEFKNDYILDKLYNEKNLLIEDFARMIGISTNTQNNGTYIAESVQFEGLGFNQFRRQMGLTNRQKYVDEFKKNTGIELKIETLKGEQEGYPQKIVDKLQDE